MSPRPGTSVPAAPRANDLNSIRVQGARENNLKNVDLTIPRDAMVVFTGLSGSGKSSLAFDTIFAEGQRRTGCRLHRRALTRCVYRPEIYLKKPTFYCRNHH